MAGLTAGKAIVTMLAANGTIYMTVYESGTTAGDSVLGSVYSLNVSTSKLTKIGDTFPAKHMPYSLLWAYGKLWCGTVVNKAATTDAGRVYVFRPDIDTSWELDETFATSECGVTGLAIFKGLIYGSLLFAGAGASTAKVKVRATDGTWTNSDTGTIDADAGGNGRGYFSLLTWPLEDGALQDPTPALYAVRSGISGETGFVIRKFNGTSWTTSYSGGAGGPDLAGAYIQNATGTIIPVIWTQNGITSLLNSPDGVTFTERFGNVTIDAGPLQGFTTQRS